MQEEVIVSDDANVIRNWILFHFSSPLVYIPTVMTELGQVMDLIIMESSWNSQAQLPTSAEKCNCGNFNQQEIQSFSIFVTLDRSLFTKSLKENLYPLQGPISGFHLHYAYDETFHKQNGIFALARQLR